MNLENKVLKEASMVQCSKKQCNNKILTFQIHSSTNAFYLGYTVNKYSCSLVNSLHNELLAKLEVKNDLLGRNY